MNNEAASTGQGQPVSGPTATTAKLGLVIFLAIWGYVISLMARNGMMDAVGDDPPVVLALCMWGPGIIFAIIYKFSSPLQRWVDRLDLVEVTALQAWRVVGIAFLMTWGYGTLTGFFAAPAGIGDILVGLAAPYVALKIERKAQGWRKSSYMLIAAGMIDFVVAIIMGASFREHGPFYQPGDLHTGIGAEFPLTLIPTFIVPVFMILHIIAFIKMRKMKDD